MRGSRWTVLLLLFWLLVLPAVPARGAEALPAAEAETDLPGIADPVTLSAPEWLTVDWVSDRQLSIRWPVTEKAEGYVRSRSRTPDGVYQRVLMLDGRKNVRALPKSRPDEIWYYRVCACRTSGGRIQYGPASEPTANIPYRDSRLAELFPDGLPKTKREMERKYLVKVKVRVYLGRGKYGYKTLKVHKALAKRVKACFAEMTEQKFPVQVRFTGSYCWRKMRTANLRSHHSYGCVVDLNWRANPMVKLAKIGHCAYRPGKNAYSLTDEIVEIWKRRGFYWGGDWPEKKDYMHLTYTNN